MPISQAHPNVDVGLDVDVEVVGDGDVHVHDNHDNNETTTIRQALEALGGSPAAFGGHLPSRCFFGSSVEYTTVFALVAHRIARHLTSSVRTQTSAERL